MMLARVIARAKPEEIPLQRHRIATGPAAPRDDWRGNDA
jgi:hypothetical protein